MSKRGCGTIIVLILMVAAAIGISQNNDKANSLPTLAVLPSLTWTPEPQSIAEAATQPPDAAIIPTVERSSSGFVTITPAPGTIYPTATITDTPIPSATVTDAPTNTPLPTSTPAPQLTPVSSDLYDVVSTANARSCPDSKCVLIGQYERGAIIPVAGVVTGETYKNSPVWIQATYHDGQTVYVHSSLVTPHVAIANPVSPVIVQPVFANTSSCPDINATCSQLTTCEQARACLAAGNTDLDGDGRGNPCESLCGDE